MKKLLFIILLAFICKYAISQEKISQKVPEQTIFVYGGNQNLKFTQYVVDLTRKSDPKVCFLPTASADNESNIKGWNRMCKKLGITPYVMKVWVGSSKKNKSFEEILLNMDAIVVGGGNTLNMLGIWKAQGIDTILRKALKKGIILSGGSAGSLCWFQSGISDSRPVNLSVIDCMSILPYSHCPHYLNTEKRELYHENIKNKTINAGYACDDRSGILFRNGKFVETVSLNDINNSYYVALDNGEVKVKELPGRILVNKDALSVEEYKKIEINKRVKDYAEMNNQDTPLNAFISLKYIYSKGQYSKAKALACASLKKRLKGDAQDKEVSEKRRDKIMNTPVEKVFIYNDNIAGVVSELGTNFYGIWFFYKEDGKWLSAGEDLGGDTVLESEIKFREIIKKHIKNYKETNSNS